MATGDPLVQIAGFGDGENGLMVKRGDVDAEVRQKRP